MKLSVLIVSWNSGRTIERCLSAVADATESIEAETLVWDNASSDDTLIAIGRAAPTAQVIGSPENVGFAVAMNRLAAIAQGEVLLLLNPDAYLEVAAIASVLSTWAGTRCIVGGLLVGRHGEVQAACARPFPSAVQSARALFGGRAQRWEIPRRGAFNVDAVSGAFMLVPHNLWVELRGFDLVYPHSSEDLDFCWRARRAGAEVVFEPAARAIHDLEASVRQATADIDALRWFGAFTFARRYEGWLPASILRFALAVQSSGLLVAAALRLPTARRRNVVRARAIWQWAVLDRLPPLPATSESA